MGQKETLSQYAERIKDNLISNYGKNSTGDGDIVNLIVNGADWQKKQLKPALDAYAEISKDLSRQITVLREEMNKFKKTEDIYSITDYARLQARINCCIYMLKQMDKANELIPIK